MVKEGMRAIQNSECIVKKEGKGSPQRAEKARVWFSTPMLCWHRRDKVQAANGSRFERVI